MEIDFRAISSGACTAIEIQRADFSKDHLSFSEAIFFDDIGSNL
jgi:hypothetical protein